MPERLRLRLRRLRSLPISLASPATTVNIVTDGREQNPHGSWYYGAHLIKGVVLVGVVVSAIVSAIKTLL